MTDIPKNPDVPNDIQSETKEARQKASKRIFIESAKGILKKLEESPEPLSAVIMYGLGDFEQKRDIPIEIMQTQNTYDPDILNEMATAFIASNIHQIFDNAVKNGAVQPDEREQLEDGSAVIILKDLIDRFGLDTSDVDLNELKKPWSEFINIVNDKENPA